MVCAPGFVFNDKTEDCDFEENVDCNGNVILLVYHHRHLLLPILVFSTNEVFQLGALSTSNSSSTFNFAFYNEL